jgi:uncharacterized protein YydD (DUF2326 family)
MNHMSDFEKTVSRDLKEHRRELERKIKAINAALREIHIDGDGKKRRPPEQMKISAGNGVVEHRVLD